MPLGEHEYVAPFDAGCAPRRTHSLAGQSGAVLLRADSLSTWTETDVRGGAERGEDSRPTDVRGGADLGEEQ